jgi:hypothetical protein
MANEQTSTAAPVLDNAAITGTPDAGASTQSTSTQAEVAQTPTNPMNTKLTPETAIVKPVAPKEAPKPTEAQMATKIDYREMISKHIEEEGGLTDDDFKSMESQGLDKDHFLMMAEAQKTIMLKNNDTLYAFVGGRDNYESLKTFANEHLSEGEIQGYNSALRSGNMKLAEMAVLGLNAMAERERGRAPQERLTADGGAQGSNDQAYSDQQSLIKDMNSRQYRNDPAFKATVDARRAKSGF